MKDILMIQQKRGVQPIVVTNRLKGVDSHIKGQRF
jgi:hypothetical protein